MSGPELTWQRFLEALPEVYLAPIVTGGAAGAILGFLGVYVVLRRMVFISAALSQVSGLGVALAFYLQIHAGIAGILGEPVVMALLLSLSATLFFRPDPSRIHLSRDSLLGLVYVVAGGVALFLGTRISQEAHDIKSILFGVGVAVRTVDLWLTLIVGSVLLLAHVILVRGIAVATFDPVSARVRGVPVGALDTFLFFSIAVAVAITTRALGALPVFGLSVLPAMAALALARRFIGVLVIATLIGAGSGILGYVYAFFTRFPVGASQTVIAGIFAISAIALRMTRSPEAAHKWRFAAGLGAALVLILAASPLVSPGPILEHTHGPGPVAQTSTQTVSLEQITISLKDCKDAESCAEAAHHASHLKDRSLIPLLNRLLEHDDWGVRAEAVETLGKIGAVEPVVEAMLKDNSSWVRATAADALKHHHTRSVLEALERANQQEKDSEAKTAIARALQHHRTASPDEHRNHHRSP